MSIIKQELKRIGLKDIWERGRNMDERVCIGTRRTCVDVDRQNLEGNLLRLCNSLRNS
jgi:hypothetical protein